MTSKTFSIALLCASLGCTVKTEKSADTSVAAKSSDRVKPDTIVFVKGDSDIKYPGASTPPWAGASFTLTPNTYGPLRVGMSVAEAARATGGGFGAPRGYSGGCGYAVLVKAPSGLAVMLQDGRIARFEERSGGIATAAGARIGDSESRIKSLYGNAVTTTPHKYVQGGHYLTVTPPSPADSAYRTIFETDGRKVTEFRSGKVPEVEQVERCG
jgi:hypothetical protein